MYDELVVKLRDHNACISIKTLDEAADAIEELSEICTEQGKVIAKIAEEKVKELPVVDVHGLVWGDGDV